MTEEKEEIPSSREIHLEPAYRCKWCGEVFDSAEHLKRHFFQEHLNMPLDKLLGRCFMNPANGRLALLYDIDNSSGALECTYFDEYNAICHSLYCEFARHFDMRQPIPYEEFRKAAEDALDNQKSLTLGELDESFERAKEKAKE